MWQFTEPSKSLESDPATYGLKVLLTGYFRFARTMEMLRISENNRSFRPHGEFLGTPTYGGTMDGRRMIANTSPWYSSEFNFRDSARAILNFRCTLRLLPFRHMEAKRPLRLVGVRFRNRN